MKTHSRSGKNMKYRVDVSECTAEEKKEVQQAFLSIGVERSFQYASCDYRDANQYISHQYHTDGPLLLLCSVSSEGSNMTAQEFLDLVYGDSAMEKKESKTFKFTDESWWDSGFGCDCCEATLMTAYNSEDTDPSLGTAHSKLDCYIQAITTVLIRRNHSRDFDTEVLYLMEEKEIKALCDAMKIEVEIDG